MKAIDRPFTNIINGTSQFVIPFFSATIRGRRSLIAPSFGATFSARRAQVVSTVNFWVNRHIATGDSLAGFTRWLLIDGQQRLTTLTLLLAALRDHIRDTGWTGGEDTPTAKRIEAYFLKNVQEEGDREQKLVLRRHDQMTLRALLDGKEPPEEGSERIRENYKFFWEQLSEANPSEVYRGISRLVIVDVALDRQIDDPQLIFESLNSTGIDLSQSDLIRNFILMRLPEKEQTRLYETYWNKIEELFRGSKSTFDAFARDYVALKTQASKQEKAAEIYYAFREFFPGLRDKSGVSKTPWLICCDTLGTYAAFSLGRGVIGDRARNLARLRHLVDVPAILVMRLLEYCDHVGTLTEEELSMRSLYSKATYCGARSAATRREVIGRSSPLSLTRSAMNNR